MEYTQEINQYIKNLNHTDRNIRLDALRSLAEKIKGDVLPSPESDQEVNNHIHTIYSFSPYSPAGAVWLSYMAGLTTSGIMDHDSISGAGEFIQAGEIIGLATTIGIEFRCDFSSTPLRGKRINNPDQNSVVYIALHGIPHTQIQRVKEYLLPYSNARNKRNRMMVEKLNRIFSQWDIQLDFNTDVVPLSKIEEQGSITERHLLFALAYKLIDRFGQGDELISFLEEEMKLRLNAGAREYLAESGSDTYAYDLLGALKSDFVESFYIDATEECPDIREFIAFGKQIGVIIAYAYLGDVGDSITGDKKSQKFEDDYLDLLFKILKELGFHAVTYMPTRNTPAQLKRVQELCNQYGFFQISGIDINSPRQSFKCSLLRKPEFRNLIDSTWAMIGHEIQATRDLKRGMFSPTTIEQYPDLDTRIAVFKEIGLS